MAVAIEMCGHPVHLSVTSRNVLVFIKLICFSNDYISLIRSKKYNYYCAELLCLLNLNNLAN